MPDNVEMLEEKKKKRKKSSIVSLVFFITSILSSAFLIYNIFRLSGIETLIRYIVIGILIIVDIVLLIKMRNVWKDKPPKKKKKKSSKRIGFITFLIIYSIICSTLGYIIFYLYGTLNSINKKYVTYSSSLVVKSDNEAKKLSDIKDYKIGILKDKKSPEGYIIPQEIIKKEKLQDNNDVNEYESYTEMIADLYTGDIDAIFISTDYPSIYSSIAGYENIGSETKIITTKEKKMLKSDTSKSETESTGKSIKEPFTILLMGIDSTDDVLTKNAVANGDSLILITFNPKTLNATMLSIPRDSYVPIACWPSKDENKITHAAAYGNDCMINTIEDYFDINIDYYAKINFKGLVNLVNALGGIDVDVPQDLCTDNSNREKIVCIKEGSQHLDGEGALVLSRNRKQLVNGDFGRGQNQQLVIQAMLEKIKDIKSVNKFTSVFNTVSNSLDTNLTTKQILSFYSVAKDIVKTGLSSDSSNIVNIQQLYLQGQGAMIYDSRMRMELYDYVPNTYSRNDIVKAMKMNLGLSKHKTIKKFSFSINKPYEKEIIGYGPYKSTYSASKYKSSDKSSKNSCGTNEELGADKVTCVCKWGYTKNSRGICSKDNEDTTTNTNNNSSEKIIYGCTDSKAKNYNINATKDNGTCEYDNGKDEIPIPGCTDKDANNYNANATKDDGSCKYELDSPKE